jgi:hypothetical protein
MERRQRCGESLHRQVRGQVGLENTLRVEGEDR